MIRRHLQPTLFPYTTLFRSVAGRVLANQGNLAHAIGRQPLGFSTTRFKMPGAELAPTLRNDAEPTRMITTLGNLDVSGSFRCGQNARCVLVVEIIGQVGNRAIPLCAREASIGLPYLAFSPRAHP